MSRISSSGSLDNLVSSLHGSSESDVHDNQVSPQSNNDSLESPESQDSRQLTESCNRNLFLGQVMKRSKWKVKQFVEDYKIKDYSGICSICLSDDPIDNQTGEVLKGPLIGPCLCIGSKAHQHKRCIENWIEQTGSSSCPFCMVRYEFTRKRKTFWSYVKAGELEKDIMITGATFAFALYLFLLGLSICWHNIFNKNSTGMNLDERHITLINDTFRELKDSFEINSEPRLALEHQIKWFNQHYLPMIDPVSTDITSSWLMTAIFCFSSITTVLLTISLISIGSGLVIRHLIRYWIWASSNFTVDVKEYRLAGLTSQVITDAFEARS